MENLYGTEGSSKQHPIFDIESNNSIAAELHPLQNPVILTHLFELCPSGLLSKLRLVSKEWHRLSFAPWRSSFPLTIRYRTEEEISVINCNEEEVHDHELAYKYPFHQFMERLQDPANDCVTKPFRKLLVQNWIFGDPLVPQEGWGILGQGVTKLTFGTCAFNGTRELCELLQDVFPNLRRLSLNSCLFTDHWIPEDSTGENPASGGHLNLQSLSVAEFQDNGTYMDWFKLLSNFPCLTGLSLVIPKNDIEKVLNAIKMIKQVDKSKLLLKDLDIYPTMQITSDPATHEKFLLCRQLSLPLQSVRIRMNPNLEERVVEEIIRFHGETLNEIVAAEDLPAPSRPCWKFPFNVKLERLQKLKISESLLESLEVLKYTPNLVRLDIMDAEHDIFKPIINAETRIVANILDHGMSGLELKRLTIFNLYYVVSDDDLRCLIKWMPNMDNLSMVLNDKQFGIVCAGWRKLTKLEVLGQELTDVGVTGLRPSGSGPEPKCTMDDADAGGNIFPNITLLQYLRLFDCWSKKLTDASIFNGFLQLANLKRLEFYSPCSTPEKMVLGEEARASLRDMSISLDIICFGDDCGCA